MVRRRVPPATLALVAVGLVAGGLWWWAVLRLLLVPGEAGIVEGAVAAGGWGLSLLPVHVAASARRSCGDGSGGRRGRSGGGRSGGGRGGGSWVTRASRRRRSGAGSGPS
ncbi:MULTISPECIES: hypothetical protein [Streptomyces]|uniref:Uncharacterized protein n=1 Tax=Streptomyces venezuelae TaxID=54571 RepID=A0A5P2ARI0_STRVZ|nr:hypothetical protein [Streptomyces venezuelae]QES19471.1 hypothetical protein DEJ46_10515 [Streptomyces venezuelae]